MTLFAKDLFISLLSNDRIQITAEQLLREAKEKQLEYVAPPPRQKISDPEELAEYRMKKRKECEDAIRKNRSKMVNWVKYAHWEESQQEIQRECASCIRTSSLLLSFYLGARSIWERALDVDYRNIAIWLKYAEMEMRKCKMKSVSPLIGSIVLSVRLQTDQSCSKYLGSSHRHSSPRQSTVV